MARVTAAPSSAPVPLRRSRSRFTRALAAVLLAASLGACSDFNFFAKQDEEPAAPAGKLYNEGLYYLNEKHNPTKAVKKFEEVDRQHPYSELARKALIMSAYSNYTAGEYEACIAAAKRYITLHPGSPDAAYAQYLIGASYFDQIPDITRDQASTENAFAALEETIRKYPRSQYAQSARNKLQVARDQLAGKEMQIGRYYMERREYLAAVNRFRFVVQEYQTTRHVEEALERLTEAYLALGLVQDAQTAAAVLGHNFPDSQWYKDSYAVLGKAGVVPEEHKGSWVSRAFGRS